MPWGRIEYEVISDGYTKIYNNITKFNIQCSEITEKKGILYIQIPANRKRQFEEILEFCNCQYKVTEQFGIIYKLKKAYKRKGILIGCLLMIAVCFYLSNVIFNIDILCDDTQINKDIHAVLKENGIATGSFMPSINFVEIERELKQKIPGISWAGISKKDSTFIVDVVLNIDKPEGREIRMPCNLVSKYDAVIDKVELYDGQLVKLVGSGVTKGDIIVSGTVVTEKISYKESKEIKDITTRFVRSQGCIYGTFTQKKTFMQPLVDTSMVIDEDSIKRKSLKVFDLYIPLYLHDDNDRYIEQTSVENFSIFGFKLPIGLRNSTLNKYTNKSTSYTEDEATVLLNEKIAIYETNFLKDFKINKAKRTENITDEGVEITVEYTLYGVISEEVEFFANK